MINCPNRLSLASEACRFAKMTKVKIIFCTILTALIALTAHILVQNWTKPAIRALVYGHTGSDGAYSATVVSVAYLTALITMFVNVVVYYYAGHLLPFKNKVAKSLLLAGLLLEMNGSLVRVPIVNYFYAVDCSISQPLLYAVYSQLDTWIPRLLIAFLLVYACPIRRSVFALPTIAGGNEKKSFSQVIG